MIRSIRSIRGYCLGYRNAAPRSSAADLSPFVPLVFFVVHDYRKACATMSKSITKSLALLQTPAPSPRDLEIYKRSVVYKHDQLNIAADCNLGQPRISKII